MTLNDESVFADGVPSRQPEYQRQDLDIVEHTGYIPDPDQKVRWMYDFDKEIYWNIRAKLHGGWLGSTKQGEYVIQKPKSAKPYMNAEGIDRTCFLVNGFVTKINSLSDYDSPRIMQLCLEINKNLARLYAVNMKRFTLTPSDARVVVRIIMTMLESNLRQSKSAVSLRGIFGSEKVVDDLGETKKMKLF